MSCAAEAPACLPDCPAAPSSLFAPVWEALHLWQTGALPCALPRHADARLLDKGGLNPAEADEAAAKKLWRA